MKYYIELTLLPSAEVGLGFLWERIFQQVHLALVENGVDMGERVKRSSVGISFPKYRDRKFPIGDKLRLFSDTEDELRRLDMNKWLNRLTDYVHLTSVREVPKSVDEFVRFKRIRCKANPELLARRRAKRKGESFEQALKHYDDFTGKLISRLPFINVKSLSGNQQLKLFIKKEVVAQAQLGDFSCYGLSKEATVPWF